MEDEEFSLRVFWQTNKKYFLKKVDLTKNNQNLSLTQLSQNSLVLDNNLNLG